MRLLESISSSISTTSDEESIISEREVIIAIIPKISGGLSMIASTFITCSILLCKQRRKKTYHRLLAFMSTTDIVTSFCYFLSTWPIPQGYNEGWDSPYHYQAVGNTATCTAQGFGIQFGITTAMYSVMLSIHYVLVIKYNITETRIKRKFEPYMIVIPLIVGLALSVPGLVLGMYNNSNLWCWISPNWSNCDQQGLSRDECVTQTYRYRWIFYYGPLWTIIVAISVIQFFLWYHVRKIEVRASRWRQSDTRAVQMRQSRNVAIQSFCYTGVFYITWLPYSAIAMTGKYFNPHTDTGFAVLCIVTIFQPLQGFLNLFVYERKRLKGYMEYVCKAFTYLFTNLKSTTTLSSCSKRETDSVCIEEDIDDDKRSNKDGQGCNDDNDRLSNSRSTQQQQQQHD